MLGLNTMSDSRKDASPSPVAETPELTSAAVLSHRYSALRKVYSAALKATLSTNSYANFASCFPTSATYCPRALEGVWKQLNTRLEEECSKDFDKICQERDVARTLAAWEQLIDEAKSRKADANGELDSSAKPPHLLTADQLHAAHLAPVLVTAEKELSKNLEKQQQENQDLFSKVEQQKQEMTNLIKQLELKLSDVEGAATIVEQDEMRHELVDTLEGRQTRHSDDMP